MFTCGQRPGARASQFGMPVTFCDDREGKMTNASAQINGLRRRCSEHSVNRWQSNSKRSHRNGAGVDTFQVSLQAAEDVRSDACESSEAQARELVVE